MASPTVRKRLTEAAVRKGLRLDREALQAIRDVCIAPGRNAMAQVAALRLRLEYSQPRPASEQRVTLDATGPLTVRFDLTGTPPGLPDPSPEQSRMLASQSTLPLEASVIPDACEPSPAGPTEGQASTDAPAQTPPPGLAGGAPAFAPATDTRNLPSQILPPTVPYTPPLVRRKSGLVSLAHARLATLTQPEQEPTEEGTVERREGGPPLDSRCNPLVREDGG